MAPGSRRERAPEREHRSAFADARKELRDEGRVIAAVAVEEDDDVAPGRLGSSQAGAAIATPQLADYHCPGVLRKFGGAVPRAAVDHDDAFDADVAQLGEHVDDRRRLIQHRHDGGD